MATDMQGRVSGYYRRSDGRTVQYWDGASWLQHFTTPDQAIGDEAVVPSPAPAPVSTVPGAALAAPPQRRPTTYGSPVQVSPMPPRAVVAPPPRMPRQARSTRRGRGEVANVVIAIALAALGLLDYRLALALGFVIEGLLIALIVQVCRRRRPIWLWGLVPALVLRGPLPIGVLTYLNQPTSIVFGVLLIAFLVVLLTGPRRTPARVIKRSTIMRGY